MGRIVWDNVNIAAHLFIIMAVIQWLKSKLNPEGMSYKALTYAFH